ncbi:MAG: sulfatase-like hydrolase/transferase [Myxococcales bacterium]|nr:sulfatase-like hydrolase/transferase [Myxococcales bacterium]
MIEQTSHAREERAGRRHQIADVLLSAVVVASAAGLCTTLIELIALIIPLPFAGSSLHGLANFAWSSHALLTLCMIPVAMIASYLGSHAQKQELPSSEVMLSMLMTLLAVWPLGRALLLFRHDTRNEFPMVMRELPSALLLLLLLGACALAWFVALPLSRRLLKRTAGLRSQRHLISASYALLALLAHWLSYRGLEPLNLGVFSGIGAICATALWVLVFRSTFADMARSKRVVIAAPTLLWVLLVPTGIGGLGHLHARYLLFNHSVGARMVGARLHDLGDIDGDGSAPLWLGGNDCAPFDGDRGPAIYDIPGDGIDQDCSGADRQAKEVSAARPGLRCTPHSENLSVLLLTVDAWHYVTLFSEVTQGVSRFAQQALLYTRAYAPANLTVHTVGAMFSGRYSSELLGNKPLKTNAPKSDNSLARGAVEHGLATKAFHHLIFPEGYDSGFPARSEKLWHSIEASHRADFLDDFRSADLSTELLSWLDGIGDRQFLAWVHYTDAHAPYLNPAVQGPLAKYNGSYEGELAYVDYHLSRVLQGVSKRGLAQRTAIVITADHGEEKGRFGREGHGTNVFDDTAHVPLILWVPGCKPELIEDAVSLSQLAPTLAQLAGFPLGGRSLLSTQASPPEGVVSEAVSVTFSGDERFYKRAFILGNDKLIHDVRRGGFLFFDLKLDPTESKDLFDEQPKRRKALMRAYKAWLDRPSMSIQ